MFYMKDLEEIPGCKIWLNKMFKEFDRLPPTIGLDTNQKKIREIESKYLYKVEKEYIKYKKLHPEEFEEKK